MEHGLHLAAHHFTMALNKLSISKADHLDQPELTNWDPFEDNFSLEDGHAMEEEVPEVLGGSFLAGDVIGKVLGLIRTVSILCPPVSVRRC
jgi:hypothetical protein